VKTILVVDDDEDQHAILRALLNHHGYSTLHARSVDEAHAILGLHTPDVIVLDLWLDDDAHGVDLLNFLVVTNRRIPIVMCTGDVHASTRYPASARVVTAWLTKPVHLADTLAAIEDAIGAAMENP
jgi:DNA-binding NtrC family response regulator